MAFPPPANRIQGWPYFFVCDGNKYLANFAGSYYKVLKAIGAIATQIEWTATQASRLPYFKKNEPLALDFFEASVHNLRRFCIEPLSILEPALKEYKDKTTKKGILEHLFHWRSQDQFVDSSGNCGTVGQALVEVKRLVHSADVYLNRVYVRLNFDLRLIKVLPGTKNFPTRPPREILLELALISRFPIPIEAATKGMSNFRTMSDVEGALGLCFNTRFTGPLFPAGRYDEGALVPKMFFICAHTDKDPGNKKWVVGSTTPRCEGFTWANDVCKSVRVVGLGGLQVANSKNAQIAAQALEGSLGTTNDLVALRGQVVANFGSVPKNLALVSRSKDSGIALDANLKPESLCYRCQIVHRYTQLASAGFDIGRLHNHLRRFQWDKHPIETAYACAESFASLRCGVYEVERGRVAHG